MFYIYNLQKCQTFSQPIETIQLYMIYALQVHDNARLRGTGVAPQIS